MLSLQPPLPMLSLQPPLRTCSCCLCQQADASSQPFLHLSLFAVMHVPTLQAPDIEKLVARLITICALEGVAIEKGVRTLSYVSVEFVLLALLVVHYLPFLFCAAINIS